MISRMHFQFRFRILAESGWSLSVYFWFRPKVVSRFRRDFRFRPKLKFPLSVGLYRAVTVGSEPCCFMLCCYSGEQVVASHAAPRAIAGLNKMVNRSVTCLLHVYLYICMPHYRQTLTAFCDCYMMTCIATFLFATSLSHVLTVCRDVMSSFCDSKQSNQLSCCIC